MARPARLVGSARTKVFEGIENPEEAKRAYAIAALVTPLPGMVTLGDLARRATAHATTQGRMSRRGSAQPATTDRPGLRYIPGQELPA
jgi:hypothetical protein